MNVWDTIQRATKRLRERQDAVEKQSNAAIASVSALTKRVEQLESKSQSEGLRRTMARAGFTYGDTGDNLNERQVDRIREIALGSARGVLDTHVHNYHRPKITPDAEDNRAWERWEGLYGARSDEESDEEMAFKAGWAAAKGE